MKRWAIFFTLLILVTGIVLFISFSHLHPTVHQVKPKYDQYTDNLAPNRKIINIGTKPNNFPENFFTECLLHDRILAQQLSRNGWKLSNPIYRSGRDMLPSAGQLEILVLGDVPAVIAMQKYNVGCFALLSQGSNALIATRRMTSAQIRGLRIGYTPNTMVHYTLERTLHSAHLTMDDIVPVALEPDEMEMAMQNHSVDAVATREPFLSAILQHFAGTRTISRSETSAYLLMNLDFYSQHPNEAKAILAAILRAAAWSRQDQEHIHRALRWIRETNINLWGTSAVGDDAFWEYLFRSETINNASFPMLPLGIRKEQGFVWDRFEFLTQIGAIPPGTQWKQLAKQFALDALPEIITDAEKWQINRFDYRADQGEAP